MNDYHHGDLRQAVLAGAAAMIARDGAEQLSLRALAAEIGVSHTAPRHHFGSREGVFTALATEGYTGLAEALVAVDSGSFADIGAAYVEFSVGHPGHFAVMHRPDLVDTGDQQLVRAQRQAFDHLAAGAARHGAGSVEADAVAAIAAWSLVHGLATLALSGALEATGLREQAGGDLPSVAARAARLLFAPDPSQTSTNGD